MVLKHDDPEDWMVWTGIIALLLYLQIVSHRQRLALLECCLALGYLCIIFPSGTFSVYVTEAKPVVSQPTCVLHFMLACLVSRAIGLHLTQNSKASEVTFCTVLSSILTRAGLALCAVQGVFDVKAISNFSCMVTLVILLPLILGDVIYLFRMPASYGMTIGDPISWHISFDAMVTFFVGSCMMAFPDLLCGQMDKVSSLIAKALGCMITGQSILSFGSLTYRNQEDAVATIKAKLVMHGICTLAAAASYFTDASFWSNGHPMYLILVCGALGCNAVSAIVADHLHQSSA